MATTTSREQRHVRLLIFGDSYVHDPSARSWADITGERLGWRSLNVAVPGSSSRTLPRQLEHVRRLVRAGSVELHETTWALVHTGGNDLLRSSAADLYAVLRAAVASALTCTGGGGGGGGAVGGRRTLCDVIADDVAVLLEGLESLGVHNVMLAGMPLTTSVPAVSQMLRSIAGDCSGLGTLVLRRLNAFHLERLRSALRDAQAAGAEQGGRSLCLDEAALIDASLRQVASRGEACDGYWRDGMHLSQRGHAALADEVVPVVQHALGLAGRPGAAARASAVGGGGGGGAWTCVSRLLCCSLDDDGAPRTKWTALVTSER